MHKHKPDREPHVMPMEPEESSLVVLKNIQRINIDENYRKAYPVIMYFSNINNIDVAHDSEKRVLTLKKNIYHEEAHLCEKLHEIASLLSDCTIHTSFITKFKLGDNIFITANNLLSYELLLTIYFLYYEYIHWHSELFFNNNEYNNTEDLFNCIKQFYHMNGMLLIFILFKENIENFYINIQIKDVINTKMMTGRIYANLIKEFSLYFANDIIVRGERYQIMEKLRRLGKCNMPFEKITKAWLLNDRKRSEMYKRPIISPLKLNEDKNRKRIKRADNKETAKMSTSRGRPKSRLKTYNITPERLIDLDIDETSKTKPQSKQFEVNNVYSTCVQKRTHTAGSQLATLPEVNESMEIEYNEQPVLGEIVEWNKTSSKMNGDKNYNTEKETSNAKDNDKLNDNCINSNQEQNNENNNDNGMENENVMELEHENEKEIENDKENEHCKEKIIENDNEKEKENEHCKEKIIENDNDNGKEKEIVNENENEYGNEKVIGNDSENKDESEHDNETEKKKPLEIVEIENTASAQNPIQKERAETMSNDANHGNSFVLEKKLTNKSFVQQFKPKYPRETMSETANNNLDEDKFEKPRISQCKFNKGISYSERKEYKKGEGILQVSHLKEQCDKIRSDLKVDSNEKGKLLVAKQTDEPPVAVGVDFKSNVEADAEAKENTMVETISKQPSVKRRDYNIETVYSFSYVIKGIEKKPTELQSTPIINWKSKQKPSNPSTTPTDAPSILNERYSVNKVYFCSLGNGRIGQKEDANKEDQINLFKNFNVTKRGTESTTSVKPVKSSK